MRRGPKLDPPERPPPCPHCGDDPMGTEAVDRTEHEGGAVTADLVCEECGEVVEEDALLREPDHV